MLARRQFILGGAALLPERARADTCPGLRCIAAKRNIVFGSEVTQADIADPAFAALIARECAVITPGLEAKWGFVEPIEQNFRFGPMDALAGFAAGHGIKLHMHNLIWSVYLPAWTLRALAEGRGRKMMQAHISAVAGRYARQTDSWDVVNEPADPRWPSDADGLCRTPWRNALGGGYIQAALEMTATAAPGARLMINDDDLEYDAPDREAKRGIYLRLIEALLRGGAPLHGFGLEAHLKPWRAIAEKPYRRFLAELAGFGLKIYVTELDVCDRFLPADTAIRDAQVAAYTRRYLDLVLDERAVCTVITWGLSDRNTWMQRDPAGQRADGLAPRCLPFDAHLLPKPMWDGIAASLRAARDRPAMPR